MEIKNCQLLFLQKRNQKLGRVVQNQVNITQDKYKIWIQIWKPKKQIQFNSFCLQFDD